MLDDHWFGSPCWGRRGGLSFRRPGRAPGYVYRPVDLGGGIAAVEALGGHSGTVARLPDGGVGQLDPGTFAGATRPPISRTRLAVAPDDEVVIVPIKVVVEP